MKLGTFFSGIGAPEIAGECLGWESVFHCENNPFCQTILKYYWPNAVSHSDITKTDFSSYRGKIDVLCGGFPCQPYSVAGKRLGKNDARHLWPHMLRGIHEIQPNYVVGENVRGIVSWNGGLVFDEVCTDLETAGYQILPFILPACSVNAPHKRDRVWFIAYANNSGRSAGLTTISGTDEKISEWNENAKPGNAGAYPATYDNERNRQEIRLQTGRQINVDGSERGKSITDTNNSGARNIRSVNGKGQAKDGEDGRSLNIGRMAAMALLPTPRASSFKGGASREYYEKKGRGPANDLQTWATFQNETTGKTSQLNPRFVAEMMGFPPDWTELPFLNGETKV